MIRQEHSEIDRNKIFAGFSQLGPGEMYADPTGSREGSDRVPAVCIFAVSASHTAPPKVSARSCARPLGAAGLRDGNAELRVERRRDLRIGGEVLLRKQAVELLDLRGKRWQTWQNVANISN